METQLAQRIKSFYAQMKSIHENRTAHSKTAENVYISLDSAEFLIEAAYNYNVCSYLDTDEVVFDTFAFVVPIYNDSVLSETDVSDFMYRIKDSMMIMYNNIAYEHKSLSLFDLEIEHSGGDNYATLVVNYSMTIAERGIPTDAPPRQFTGTDSTAWGTLTSYCGYTYVYGTKAYNNAYVMGNGLIKFSNNTVTSLNCSNAGAALYLRNQGIFNYRASYTGNPYSIPPLLVNITKAPPINPASASVNNWYRINGYGNYLQTDQYNCYCNYTTNGAYVITGTSFYAHWLNTPMMNYYLGYIPAKINAAIPAGKVLRDFQIERYESSELPVLLSDIRMWCHMVLKRLLNGILEVLT